MKSIWDNRTKVLGYLQVVIGALAVADPVILAQLLGPHGLKWVLLANGLLTAAVGHHNTLLAKRSAKP